MNDTGEQDADREYTTFNAHDSECESRTEFEYVRSVKYCVGCGGGEPETRKAERAT